jgi:isopenicillin N synthase-like dioxygenase
MNNKVPVLDLDRYDFDRKSFVQDVSRAYRDYGFCGFFNHSIPRDVIDPKGNQTHVGACVTPKIRCPEQWLTS